jgi:RNA polymerase sigma factor (sigma-70 family)
MESIGSRRLTQVLDEHGAALVLYARQFSTSPEDIVQEAVLRLARQSPPPENESAWLYRVVRNIAISAARASNCRKRHEQAAGNGRAPWFVGPTDNHTDIDAEAATAALEHLPLQQRETIVARLWGGRTLQEIAELTGTSTSTVHRRYQAGLSAMRERLDAPCPKTKR